MFALLDTFVQSKCDTLVKEREAVTTIMEQKIKVLVQSVAQSVSAVVSSNPEVGGSAAGQALSKDLHALQRLVGASIAALKNAANSTPAPVSTASTGAGGAANGANGVAPVAGPPRVSKPLMPAPQPVQNQNLNVNQLPPNRYLGSDGKSGYPSNGAAAGISLPLPSFNSGTAPTSFSTPNSNTNRVPVGVPRAPQFASATAGAVGLSQGPPPQGAGANGWGAKDEYYSSGDVFRSTDRRLNN